MEDGTPNAQVTTDAAPQDAGGLGAPKAEGSQASQPAVAKESGTAPWQKDLDEFGFDPEITSKFSEYLRTQWQPRMTQHEQNLAQWSKLFDGDLEAAQIAAGFFGDLNKDPRAAFQQLEAALREGGHLDDPSGDNTPTEPDVTEDDTPDPEKEWVRSRMEQEQQQAEIKAYEDAVKKVAEEHFGGEDLNRTLFDKLFIANKGDMEATLADYTPLHQGAPPADPPPPGTGTGDAPPAPQAGKKIQTMDDALDAFFEEERARNASIHSR